MSETSEEDKSQQGEDEEAESTLPELWRYASEDRVGRIVHLLNEKEEEELPDAIQERNPENDQSLLMWATLKQRFVLVEWLIKRGKREAYAFRDRLAVAIYDRWVEERKAKQERDQEAAEEAAQRAADGIEEEEEDEEDKEPEPELWQLVLEGIEEEGVDEFKVKRIGELGIYEGGRDAAGNKNGLGQSLFVNGDLYIGEYKDNKREGTGTYYWAVEGNTYSGDWGNNQRAGLGRMIYTDGGRYYGSWLNDRKNGKGRYTYPNGDTYDGDWQDDRKEGNGTYTFAADSSRYVGTYRNGDFTSGKWVLCGGTTYYGVFRNFKPTGKGVFVFNGKFKQEGEYVKGKFTPAKIRNLKADTEVDLLITLQGNRIRLRYTPEQGDALGLEQLVNVANFRPFEEWATSLERQRKVVVTDLRIRSLDLGPNNEIQSVRLKVDAYKAPAITDKEEPKQRLPQDMVILQAPVTVVVVILVHDGTEYILAVRQPRVSASDFTYLELPTGVQEAGGSFRGAAIRKLMQVFQLNIRQPDMMDMTELCFGDAAHNLLTSPAENSSNFNIWLYKQHVHAHYFETLADRIAFHNRDGDAIKVEMHTRAKVMEIVTDNRSITTLMLLESLRDRMPQQTCAPQRPPTPPPPEPEPVPLYSEEELAMQKAALEAELAAKKEKDERQGDEEEEED